jgi:outer membrane protein assembly factor BamE (lipoprotein component of BamABCDE complex)
MKKAAIVSVVALSLVWVSMLSCSGASVYDLNTKSQPEPPKPPRSTSWREALGEVVLPLFDRNDTEYATAFKEEVFRALEMGLSQDDVKRRLGEPVSTKTFSDGDTCWYYSRHGKQSKSYFVRLLEFDGKGILVARRSAFYLD